MPKSWLPYPPEYRRKTVALVPAGRSPNELASEFGCSTQGVRHWLAQAEADAGKREVLPTTTADEEVLRMASERNSVFISCNRDDFLGIARQISHRGTMLLVRRRSRASQRAGLLQRV